MTRTDTTRTGAGEKPDPHEVVARLASFPERSAAWKEIGRAHV